MQVAVKTSDKYTCWKTVEAGENVYLPSHINVFWLAIVNGITPPALRFGGFTWIGRRFYIMAATLTVIPGHCVGIVLNFSCLKQVCDPIWEENRIRQC